MAGLNCLYPSYFKLQVCWLRSFTRITYLSKLIGIHSLAAFLQLELFWVYTVSKKSLDNEGEGDMAGRGRFTAVG
ncbi:hypothetical protein W909_17510 [Dickeya zeae EC1]|nr:hypothetical protein W909_17510 [Dickeya zeae EC1]